MDAASRCDDLCNEGEFRTYYWLQKCKWVECKGCKECTPENITEDAEESRRRNERAWMRPWIGYKELHEKGVTDKDLAAAGFKHVRQCSSLKDDPEGCEKAYTKITKWHWTRGWETRR